eukprot:TRINITY_DN8060_c0_g1_i1.p1 TRINITY_DN8060_c0_g1~~TRINITY_DN8060_c0_g1_i1.p1  ORF type:complete len:334 (+),score=58.83 TRINITY_DN8060_c0_g1_i1:223-1224(+)
MPRSTSPLRYKMIGGGNPNTVVDDQILVPTGRQKVPCHKDTLTVGFDWARKEPPRRQHNPMSNFSTLANAEGSVSGYSAPQRPGRRGSPMKPKPEPKRTGKQSDKGDHTGTLISGSCGMRPGPRAIVKGKLRANSPTKTGLEPAGGMMCNANTQRGRIQKKGAGQPMHNSQLHIPQPTDEPPAMSTPRAGRPTGGWMTNCDQTPASVIDSPRNRKGRSPCRPSTLNILAFDETNASRRHKFLELKKQQAEAQRRADAPFQKAAGVPPTWSKVSAKRRVFPEPESPVRIALSPTRGRRIDPVRSVSPTKRVSITGSPRRAVLPAHSTQRLLAWG